VLSTSGDSGAYVQYAYARCCRTIEKSGKSVPSDANLALLDQPSEWSLALSLSQFPDVVSKAAHANDPHLLSRYLLDLVSHFSGWYTGGNQDKSLRVLCEDEDTQKARLVLVAMTRSVLKEGLAILGLQAPDAM
jgi:arginyl-tRNA synthetase